MELSRLGWSDHWHAVWETLAAPEHKPARVASAHREHYRLWEPDGEFPAALSGRLRHAAANADTDMELELPVVGDWVAVRRTGRDQGALISAVLPRRTTLARKRPDGTSSLQLMAANVDCVFIVSSLNRDFNPRRIERALALVWEGGAQPVVVLSKLDLCSDPEPYLEQAAAIAPGVPVHAVSVQHEERVAALRDYVQPHRTAALIGASGVGKSTLLNWFLGTASAVTAPVRASDDRGRHTTTARALYVLPSGGVLIDTPGMREFGLGDAEAGLQRAFDDVARWVVRCRFTDCRHRGEPGCAIAEALASGRLDARRFAAYEKLQRELAYEVRRHSERDLHEHQRRLRQVFRERTRAQRSRSRKPF